MELKYYIGFTPYFVDKGQVVDFCDNYYYSTDGKTCYGFDSEGNYYVTKRIDAISPLMTFKQHDEDIGGIDVVTSFPGEEPTVELAVSDFKCSTFDIDKENSLLFSTNHIRIDKENSNIR